MNSVRRSRELLDELFQALIKFQIHLEEIMSFKVKMDYSAWVNPLLNTVDSMKQSIVELKSMERVTLVGQDYTNLCLLIIYGSEMSQYLLAGKYNSRESLQHARYWQETAMKFKEFLQRAPETTA